MADPTRKRRSQRLTVLGAALVLLLVTVALSLSVGSKQIPLDQVWHDLMSPDGSVTSAVVRELRLPRTAMAITIGAALGLAGALMQALTRNPLADPGLLGVNAGAALAVVLAVALLGANGILAYLWFAFAGAAVAAIGVYALAGTGRHTATPARLALAGVAVSAALAALTQTVILTDQEAFNEFRFWVAGSLEGRGWGVLGTVAPFLVVGVALAMLLGPALNALALGDETGRALGVPVGRIRLGAVLAVTLLCGAATAAVGPIAFVGLAVPMITRALVGHDYRWIAPICLVLGAVWLLSADALARVIIAPQEVQTGIVAALLGGPVFVAVVRRRKVPSL